MEMMPLSISAPPLRVIDTLAVPELQIRPERPVESAAPGAAMALEPWVCQPQCDPNAPPPWWWLQKWAWQPTVDAISVSPQAMLPDQNTPLPVDQSSETAPDSRAICQPHKSDEQAVALNRSQPAIPEAPIDLVIALNYAYVSNLGTLMDVLC